MSEGKSLDRRGLAWGMVAVAIVMAFTFIGSDQLVWFDAALVGYLFGSSSRCSASSTGTRCGCGGRRRRC